MVRLGTEELETVEFLNRLQSVFPGSKIEIIGIETLKPVREVNWWEGVTTKIPLKTIRPTKVYLNKFKTVTRKELPKDDVSLQYWGEIVKMTNYTLARVFGNPEMWVDVEDVRPGG